MKYCKKCDDTKEFSEFYKDRQSKDGLTKYCKSCCKSAERDYHKRNPAVKFIRKRKDSSLITPSGTPFTNQVYKELLSEQNGKCGICQQEMSPPCIDHNHETGVVRKLLCGHCNKMIGFAKESVETLANSIKYLNSFT